MSELAVDLKDNIVDQQQFNKDLEQYYSGHKENSKKSEWTSDKTKSVIKLIEECNLSKGQGRRPSNKQYHHAKKYDIMTVGDEKMLIVKRKSHSDPVVQIIPSSEYYHVIFDAHIATGHGRRDKIVHALKNKYAVPIFAVTTFLQLCKTCLAKKSFPKSGIVVKPLISDDFNRRGQVDLVDFQSSPDEEYKWMLQYQDHLTKFCFLRPLKSKEAKEVAIEIHSKNVVGKVIQKKNELYRVGTSCGIINDWLPRNAILPSSGTILSDDIPEDTLPLRTISAMSSSFGGQGMRQCNCKKISKGQCII